MVPANFVDVCFDEQSLFGGHRFQQTLLMFALMSKVCSAVTGGKT
jgi:hypothetical protein